MADDKKQQAPEKKESNKRYTKYEAEGDKIKRKLPFCPKCGPGIFLAGHKDRRTCGKCGYMEKL